jgi:MYXO-CTERM domain-containing protein
VLEAGVLANGGSNSSIGKSANVAASLVFGAPAASLRYTGSSSVTINRGLTVSSGAGGGATIESSGSGTLGGTGTIGGPVSISGGILAPGDRALTTAAAGTLTIANAVTLGGTTEMRLFSPTGSDKLWQTTAGSLTYGGILKIIDLAPVAFAIGNTWDLFDFTGQSGKFTNDSEFGTVGGTYLPTLSVGQKWSFDYGTGVLSVASAFYPGDTNADLIVDAADFINLKKNFGKAGGVAQGDFNNTGTVNWADLSILLDKMGTTGGAPATTPEPCSAMLLVFGAAALLRRRRS